MRHRTYFGRIQFFLSQARLRSATNCTCLAIVLCCRIVCCLVAHYAAANRSLPEAGSSQFFEPRRLGYPCLTLHGAMISTSSPVVPSPRACLAFPFHVFRLTLVTFSSA